MREKFLPDTVRGTYDGRFQSGETYAKAYSTEACCGVDRNDEAEKKDQIGFF